jgi:ABC-type transport system involved in cytochrome c biogenesis permease subunit
LTAAVLAATASAGAVEPSADLDLRAWQQLPVFHRGRIMPMDSYAREAVETICGRVGPRLVPEGAAACAIFPAGKPRTFTAAELLLSWMVEPEQWENVAFLTAEREDLRKDLLGLPLFAPDGQRLKYVSPRQLERARPFHARLGDLAERESLAEKEDAPLELAGLDKSVKTLFNAYRLFRLLTFNPSASLDHRDQSITELRGATEIWNQREPLLAEMHNLVPGAAATAAFGRARDAMRQLRDLAGRGALSAKNLEPILAAMRQATATLAEEYTNFGRQPPPVMRSDAQQLRGWRSEMNHLAKDLDDVSHRLAAAQWALYDSGQSLRLVPAIDADALRAGRDAGDGRQPWLGLRLLLSGSNWMLGQYPQAELKAVRETYRQMATTYIDRTAADRRTALAAAAGRFAAAIRALGQRIEPLRQTLPIENRDEALLTATAYPPPGYTDVELHYNQLDPFGWSWLLDFLAVVCLALSFGVIRKPMFWLGLATLAAGQLLTAYGFALRTYVTGWAPVTGMFETVVYVALVGATLGVWFTIVPLLRSGLRSAWLLSAAPGTWEAGTAVRESIAWERRYWPASGWLCLAPRAALMYAIFTRLASAPYGSGASPLFHLLPRISVGAALPSLMELTTWLTGLCVLAAAVWYVPRVLVSALLALATIPYSLARERARRPLELVLARKTFVLAGALVAFLVALTAYYSPLWNKEIGSLTPVLRNHFWLYIHVLTITSSYGAGALAWGLGLLSLGYFLFGRYREPVATAEEAAALGPPIPAKALVRRAPEPCNVLGGYIYKASQVAVLLLAAGTILGALWADVAWGRFWGWDAKEVWALISLLVYLAFLHGRYAGWIGNFGMAAGSVAGATAITMAWYGVNYYLRTGLHSYALGAGGQMEVGLFLLGNWIFLLAALARYRFETG